MENREDEYRLMEEAKAILAKAYAPYSGFLVGAAVQLKSGKILQSNNQENVSFPVGICAERSALAYASANFPEDPPVAIAIAAQRKGEKEYAKVAPCGLCCQTMMETETRYGNNLEIFLLEPSEEVVRISGVSKLLPFALKNLDE